MSTQHVPLGRTDIKISPIGLGTWQFSQGKGMAGSFWRSIPQEETNKIVKSALEGGINWFDTAEIYGNGRSEASLTEALRANGVNPGDVLIATKWWPMFRTAGNIRKTIGKRLKFLDGFGIDLYQIHQPYGFSSPEAEMKAMGRLVRDGKIRSVGVSNFSAKQMRRAHDKLHEMGIPLASNQVKYNLLNRSIETNGVLETARELGVTIIAYSPLEQGILTGKFHREPEMVNNRKFRRKMKAFQAEGLEKSRPLIELLEEIAGVHDTSAAAVALHWLIRFQGETVVAIPGASKPEHLTAHLEALRIRLGKDELDQIDQVSKKASLRRI